MRSTAGSRTTLNRHRAVGYHAGAAPLARVDAHRRALPGRRWLTSAAARRSRRHRGQPVGGRHRGLGRRTRRPDRRALDQKFPRLEVEQAGGHQVRRGRAVRVHLPPLGRQASLHLRRRGLPAVRGRRPGQARRVLQRHRPSRTAAEGVGDVHRAHPAGAEALRPAGRAWSDDPGRPGLYFAVSKEKKDNNFFEYDVETVSRRATSRTTGASEPLGDDEIAEAMQEGPVHRRDRQGQHQGRAARGRR